MKVIEKILKKKTTSINPKKRTDLEIEGNDVPDPTMPIHLEPQRSVISLPIDPSRAILSIIDLPEALVLDEILSEISLEDVLHLRGASQAYRRYFSSESIWAELCRRLTIDFRKAITAVQLPLYAFHPGTLTTGETSYWRLAQALQGGKQSVQSELQKQKNKKPRRHPSCHLGPNSFYSITLQREKRSISRAVESEAANWLSTTFSLTLEHSLQTTQITLPFLNQTTLIKQAKLYLTIQKLIHDHFEETHFSWMLNRFAACSQFLKRVYPIEIEWIRQACMLRSGLPQFQPLPNRLTKAPVLVVHYDEHQTGDEHFCKKQILQTSKQTHPKIKIKLESPQKETTNFTPPSHLPRNSLEDFLSSDSDDDIFAPKTIPSFTPEISVEDLKNDYQWFEGLVDSAGSFHDVMNDLFLKSAVKEYEKFLLYAKQNPNTKIGPSFAVDLIWHTCIIYESSHQSIVQRYLGFSPVHNPGENVPPTEEQKKIFKL